MAQVIRLRNALGLYASCLFYWEKKKKRFYTNVTVKYWTPQCSKFTFQSNSVRLCLHTFTVKSRSIVFFFFFLSESAFRPYLCMKQSLLKSLLCSHDYYLSVCAKESAWEVSFLKWRAHTGSRVNKERTVWSWCSSWWARCAWEGWTGQRLPSWGCHTTGLTPHRTPPAHTWHPPAFPCAGCTPVPL